MMKSKIFLISILALIPSITLVLTNGLKRHANGRRIRGNAKRKTRLRRNARRPAAFVNFLMIL